MREETQDILLKAIVMCERQAARCRTLSYGRLNSETKARLQTVAEEWEADAERLTGLLREVESDPRKDRVALLSQIVSFGGRDGL